MEDRRGVNRQRRGRAAEKDRKEIEAVIAPKITGRERMNASPASAVVSVCGSGARTCRWTFKSRNATVETIAMTAATAKAALVENAISRPPIDGPAITTISRPEAYVA